MTSSNFPRLRVNLSSSGRFFAAVAILAAIALLVAGCKRSADKGNTLFADETNSSNQTKNGGESAEVIKGQADTQGQATKPDKGNFSVEYSKVNNPTFAQMNEDFRRQRTLEGIADDLNAAIAIPENVKITFLECGQPNAFWDPQTRSINMCYELMAQMTQDFKEVAKDEDQLNQMVGGALTFAFIHELGHCLIDVLNLPSTGREEDAVDQLSTFVLLALKGEEGEKMAISGAISWGIQYERLAKSGKTAGELNMLWADEHSMDGQRFYNILCWIFGHNPQKWQKMINDPLPEQRAVRCPMEYSKLASAWLTLLKPYLKDGGAKAAAHTGPMVGSPPSMPQSQPAATPAGGGHSEH